MSKQHFVRVLSQVRSGLRLTGCRAFGHTTTNHGPFWGSWPDRECRRCGKPS